MPGFTNHYWMFKQDKVFKSGLSKFCGRQPLKSLKGYGYASNIDILSISISVIRYIRYFICYTTYNRNISFDVLGLSRLCDNWLPYISHVAGSPGSTSDKGLSQQSVALLKNELLHLRFCKSFKKLLKAIKISWLT